MIIFNYNLKTKPMTAQDLIGYETVLLTHRRLARNLLTYYEDLKEGLTLIRTELAKTRRKLKKVKM